MGSDNAYDRLCKDIIRVANGMDVQVARLRDSLVAFQNVIEAMQKEYEKKGESYAKAKENRE